MEERIARFKTSQVARKLADSARRLGHPELEARALQRASDLKASNMAAPTPRSRLSPPPSAYKDQQSRLRDAPASICFDRTIVKDAFDHLNK